MAYSYAMGFVTYISGQPSTGGGYELNLEIHVHDDGDPPNYPYVLSAFADIALTDTPAQIAAKCVQTVIDAVDSELDITLTAANIRVLGWAAG